MPDTSIEVKKTPEKSRTLVDPWRSFQGEMDRLFDRFATGFGWPAPRRFFDIEPLKRFDVALDVTVPPVDVNEDDKAYTLTAELPGMDEKNVEVSVTGDMLTLKGEKRQEKEEKSKNYYLSERSYGAFKRSLQLPDGIDRDKIGANFAKGVLTITLPKTGEAQKQQKKIEVKAA